MKVGIAIDPSTTNIGVCILDLETMMPIEFKSFNHKSKDKAVRLQNMCYSLYHYLKNHLYEGVDIFIEYPVVGRGATSSLMVAEAVGYIKGILSAMVISDFGYLIVFKEINVSSVKKVTRVRDKAGVVRWTLEHLKSKGAIMPDSEHSADAFLIGYAGYNQFYLKK